MPKEGRLLFECFRAAHCPSKSRVGNLRLIRQPVRTKKCTIDSHLAFVRYRIVINRTQCVVLDCVSYVKCKSEFRGYILVVEARGVTFHGDCP